MPFWGVRAVTPNAGGLSHGKVNGPAALSAMLDGSEGEGKRLERSHPGVSQGRSASPSNVTRVAARQTGATAMAKLPHFDFFHRLVNHCNTLSLKAVIRNKWLNVFIFWPNPRAADLSGTDLSYGYLNSVGAVWHKAKLIGANLTDTKADTIQFLEADLCGANLSGASLVQAYFMKANLSSANLSRANLFGAYIVATNLKGANLTSASLIASNLSNTDLRYANLKGANLTAAILIGTDLRNADLSGCRIHGISAWGLRLNEGTKQQNLIITPEGDPDITVDNIEVAQFLYLLLHSAKIRDAIDAIGRKGVLLLGRFTEGRVVVLERLRDELRKRGYLPIVFNFDKPETKDFTETVRLLAGLSKFVIADVTNPRSAPLELQAIVPEIMVPLQPIIEDGQTAFAMLEDLQRKHDWVFPTLRYSSLDRLIETMDEEIVAPAEAKFRQLLVRRADPIEDRRV